MHDIKTIDLETLPTETGLLQVDPGNYQDRFPYGKSIEGIDYETLKNKPETSSSAKKYCFATNSSNQSLNNTTGTTISLNTYETNDSAMSATANRIIIPTAGQYLVTAAVQYAANGTGSREAFVRVNGGTVLSDNYAAPNSSDLTTVIISTIRTFSANDYVDLRGYQNSGGSLNVIGGIANTYLSVHQL